MMFSKNLFLSILFLSTNFFLCGYKHDKQTEDQKNWLQKVEERIQSRKLSLAAAKVEVSSAAIKIEDLYKETFGKEGSWPNIQRRIGQTIKMLLQTGGAALAVHFIETYLIKDSLGHGLKLKFVAVLLSVIIYQLLDIPLTKLAKLINWDPRSVAFANKIIHSIDSGKSLVSENAVVQDLTDNVLAENGRSTVVIKLQDRMNRKQKVEMAERIRRAIELSGEV